MTTANSDTAKRLLEQEDAADLKFGDDFLDGKAKPLFNAEVFFLLEAQKETEQEDEDMMDRSSSEMFQKTLMYCQKFSNFKTKDAARDVRRALENKQLFRDWEIACLANLCPDQWEEARYLIRSLDGRTELPGKGIVRDKLDDSLLQDILDEINVLKSFQA